MINFEKLLNEAKGKPINYKDKLIFRGEFISIPPKCKIKISIISTNSEWKQGIELNTKGSFVINDKTIKNSIRLWEDTAPKEVVFDIKSKDKKLRIDNIWDHGDGVVQKWVNGSAMYSKEMSSGKRYFCNDGHPDDDFDDLVFSLLILEE